MTLARANEPSAQRGSLSFPRVNTVYVSAVDRHDAPVTGLAAADFVLKEGGDIREIVKIERATALMHIAMIVDDSGTGIFRYPVAAELQEIAEELNRPSVAVPRCARRCAPDDCSKRGRPYSSRGTF